ncbi:MAG: DUF2062 domain-containing protein [Nanoarchaeota archaeon]|nr:DUF2062 domain-containing protein [Nanoarchaeota archaeon]
MDLREHFRKVISIKKSPHSIALGFAIGTLIAMLPTFGFGPLFAAILMLIFTKLNKFSLFGSFIIWNPIMMMPFYYLNFKLGNLILGSAPAVKFEFSIMNAVHFLSLRFVLGSIIISTTMVIVCYFIVRKIAKKFQKKLFLTSNSSS